MSATVLDSCEEQDFSDAQIKHLRHCLLIFQCDECEFWHISPHADWSDVDREIANHGKRGAK